MAMLRVNYKARYNPACSFFTSVRHVDEVLRTSEMALLIVCHLQRF